MFNSRNGCGHTTYSVTLFYTLTQYITVSVYV